MFFLLTNKYNVIIISIIYISYKETNNIIIGENIFINV